MKCAVCKYDMGDSYENCGGCSDGTCPECGTDNPDIDKRELDDLEREYKELSLADLTDDIDCSLGTIKFRANRLAAIEDIVSKHIADAWFEDVLVTARESGMASGKVFEE